MGQTARAVLSDALFERIRNDVERLKINNRMRKKLRPQILSCERAFYFLKANFVLPRFMRTVLIGACSSTIGFVSSANKLE